MSDYLQPDFYRFNQDSLTLVNWIKGQLASAQSVLDLGAGCGVMGLELARHYQPATLVLLELQTEFESSLQHNVKTFAPAATDTQIILSSFAHFTPKQYFDLIVINPPYFLAGRGESSADFNKHQCRTFIRDNWGELGQCIERSLATDGQCFLVIRQDPQVLREMRESFTKLRFDWKEEEKDKLLLISLRLTE